MNEADITLGMIRRHVRQGAEQVANQRALLAQLRADRLPVEAAEALLVSFEEIQRQHEDHLSRAKAEAFPRG